MDALRVLRTVVAPMLSAHNVFVEFTNGDSSLRLVDDSSLRVIPIEIRYYHKVKGTLELKSTGEFFFLFFYSVLFV